MEHRIPKRDLRREIGSKVRSWFFLEKIVDPYCVERNSPRGQLARMASAVRGLIGYLARFDKLQHQRANTALESQKGRTRCNRGSFLCVCGPVGVLEVQCCTFGQCESGIPFLNWKGSRRGNLHFWPTFPGAVRICCIREGPVHSFFFPSSSVSFFPFFFARQQHTQQNSLLFYLEAPFSGRPCRHHHLLVLNYLHLPPTTRQKMPPAQSNLSSINVNPNMRKMSLPNLSYPIRSIHAPWVESSVPLVITARYLQCTLLP